MVGATAHEQRELCTLRGLDHRRHVIGMLGSYDGNGFADSYWEVWGPCPVVRLAFGEHLAIHTPAKGIEELVGVLTEVHHVPPILFREFLYSI
jgi:hypothetical protein